MHSNKKIVLFLTILLPLLATIFSTDSQATGDGANLYLGHCAKCHGREGEGFLKLYPPIRNSSYLNKDVAKLPCIIRYGLKGKIVVDGVTFNQIMPAIQILKPEEIEQIIQFLQTNWDHPPTLLDIPKWLTECSKGN